MGAGGRGAVQAEKERFLAEFAPFGMTAEEKSDEGKERGACLGRRPLRQQRKEVEEEDTGGGKNRPEGRPLRRREKQDKAR